MKSAAIFGGTGLIGSKLISELNMNPTYAHIFSFERKSEPNSLGKLEILPLSAEHITFPSTLVDSVFCCIGTTMKKAGSQKAFRAVDYNLVLKIAQAAKANGVKNFVVVSSIGANAKSNNFYLKVKGEMEQALSSIGFEHLVIVRPSLLLGKRKETRISEGLGKVFFKLFSFIFVDSLAKYKGIEAHDVAKAMIFAAQNSTESVITLESNNLQDIADEYTNR
ncbi:MAG: NAD(P)H-binding protein [Bacteroidales bacterium]|nr:NAD(P)H-binding protein [Bacteroidales bacterium]MBN2750261.1 NAD(P)H-binding protein [Bacteroidales bacterium]